MTLKHTVLGFVVALCLLFSAGCSSQKSVVVLLPNPDGSVGKVVVTSDEGSTVLDSPFQGAEVEKKNAPSEAKIYNADRIRSEFPEVLSARPDAPRHFLLYFTSGSTDLTAESRKSIPAIVDETNKREMLEISVIGHCDRIGSEEYNLKLSLDRAKAVLDLLVENGVDPETIELSSHGEANPLIPTADNVAEPRNRRVEVIIR